MLEVAHGHFFYYRWSYRQYTEIC